LIIGIDLSKGEPRRSKIRKRIAVDGTDMPVIFITGYGDVPKTVQAMKSGAVSQALERSRLALSHEVETQGLQNRCASLTPCERQVMALVVSGLLNKHTGGGLGISEITVKAHRGQVMQKMKADSLADLVRMAAKRGPAPQTHHLA